MLVEHIWKNLHKFYIKWQFSNLSLLGWVLKSWTAFQICPRFGVGYMSAKKSWKLPLKLSGHVTVKLPRAIASFTFTFWNMQKLIVKISMYTVLCVWSSLTFYWCVILVSLCCQWADCLSQSTPKYRACCKYIEIAKYLQNSCLMPRPHAVWAWG